MQINTNSNFFTELSASLINSLCSNHTALVKKEKSLLCTQKLRKNWFELVNFALINVTVLWCNHLKTMLSFWSLFDEGGIF